MKTIPLPSSPRPKLSASELAIIEQVLREKVCPNSLRMTADGIRELMRRLKGWKQYYANNDVLHGFQFKAVNDATAIAHLRLTNCSHYRLHRVSYQEVPIPDNEKPTN